MNQHRSYGGVASVHVGPHTEDRISTRSCQVPLLRSETVLVYFRRSSGRQLRRKEKTSVELMLGCPYYLVLGGFVFAIILDVLEDLVRKVQLPVDVAGIRIVGVRTDGELLLVLPL